MRHYSHLLTTSVVKNGIVCGGTFQTFAQFPTRRVRDGLVLTDDAGLKLKVLTSDRSGNNHLILQYLQDIGGKETVGALKVLDPVLARRIVEYVTVYYGKARTNCGALAQFLKTGEFTQSGYLSRHAFIVDGAFDVYEDQRIGLGDRVCLLYYDKALRENPKLSTLHELYDERLRTARESWRNTGHRVIPTHALEICAQYDLGIYADFHFLTCVGSREGEPVFIQQMGIHDPATGRSVVHAPIILSVGTVSVSQHEPVAFAFIQHNSQR